MNARIRLSVSAVAFCVLFFLTVTHAPQQPPRSHDAEERGPSDALQALNYWSAARAYPQPDIPPGKYYREYVAARGRMKPLPTTASTTTSVWDPIGPMNGDSHGRSISAAVNPDNPSTVYCGTSSGGLWVSHSAATGGDWTRVTLGYPALGISAIVIDPADTATMYLGTGEVYRYAGATGGLVIRTTRGSYGVGILKTTDGGATWTKSLDWAYNEQRGIQQIQLNPQNRNTLFAATTEGVYRSRNRGDSWEQVNGTVMATDVLINASDTNLVLAAFGNFKSTGFGIYRSTDAGDSWTYIAGGQSNYSGKTLLEAFAANPSTVYASVADSTTSLGGLWRSTDFGASWTLINSDAIFGVQGWYSHFVAVHATDSTKIVHAGLSAYKSINGGTSFFGSAGGYSDNHNYAHDPSSPDILYIVNDNGIFRSTNFGDTFTDIGNGMQTLQFYNGFANSSTDSLIAVGQVQDHIPGYLYQGSLTWHRPSGTDEVGWAAIDPTNDNIMYAIDRNGTDFFKSTDRGLSFGFKTSFDGYGAWNSPMALCPAATNVIYAAKQHVFKSTDAGNSFTKMNGGSMLDGNPALAIAISAKNPDTAFVGTGALTTTPHVFRTTNGGTSWTDVTGTLPDRWIMDLTVNPKNTQVVYAALGGFGSGHVFRSTDLGTSWTDITGTLPDVPTAAIFVDPYDTSVVFAGNDLGVYVSTNSGGSWSAYSEGLPEAVISADLSMSDGPHILRVATHGNGVYQRKVDIGVVVPDFDYRAFNLASPGAGTEHLLGSAIAPVSASFRNVGLLAQTDSFDVRFRILHDNAEVYTSTRRIAGLGASEIRTVTFTGSFTPGDTGTFVSEVTSLAQDQDASNDTLRGSFSVILPPSITYTQATKIYCTYSELLGGSPGPGGDDVQLRIPLPFSFVFDGYAYDSLMISTNGWVEFGTGPRGSLRGLSTNAQIGSIGANENGRMATTQHPLKALGVWWDDLNTDPVGASVSYATLGSAPNRTFVVQWKNVRAYYDPGSTTTLLNFQVKLYENTGFIDFSYGPVVAGSFGGSDIGAMTGLKDHLGGDFHYYDLARMSSGLASEVETNLSPLADWPGEDSCYRIGIGTSPMLVGNEEGWNLVSVPLTRVDNSYLSVFPGGIAGTFWKYDASYKYPAPAEFVPGLGYWLKFSSAGVALMAGDPLDSVSVALATGWNIIGSVDHTVGVPAGGTITGNVFGYSTSGGYAIAGSLEPGKAYWVKSTGPSVITLGPTAAPKTTAFDLTKDLKLTFADARGRSQSLYVSSRPQDATELPPPPAGGLNVRFTSNRFVEAATGSGEFPVVLASDAYPVTVRWKNPAAAGLMAHLASGTRTIAVNAAEGSALIETPEQELRLVIESVSPLPSSYALEQNYPNPFNPSTVIRYQIPEAGRVTLAVYNLVGQKVATLVDGQEEAGMKSVVFDAQNFPSGIYFYRLRAGAFTDVHKMLLVK